MNIKFILVICLLFPILAAEINPPLKPEKEAEQDIIKNFGSSRHEVSESRGNTAEAKILLEKAILYIKEYGEEKAFKQFNNPNSEFFYKDLYIFVIDMEGNVLAHGGQIELVGTNQYDLKDSVGKFFIREFIEELKDSDEAMVEYYWRNYDTLEIEYKMTYLKKIPGNKFIGCGIYYGHK